MASADDREFTTTLRLGSAPGTSPSDSGLLEGYLSAATGDEKATLDEIVNGSSKKAMLVIYKGPSQGSRYLITSAGASIGRAHESEVFLDDVTVSRAHATIALGEGSSRFEIADSSSLNGTYVNGKSIEKVLLNNGDEVQIGKFHLLFVTGQK